MGYFLHHRKFFGKLYKEMVFASIAGSVALGAFVHFVPVLNSDIAISQDIQSEMAAAIAKPVMSFISFFGIPWVASTSILTASIAFFMLSFRREAAFMLATFVADGANMLLKLAVARPRPTPRLVSVFERLTDPSFPSGHVVHYVVFFGFLYVALFSLWRPNRFMRYFISTIFFLLVFSVSLSRIYLGAHWATDVLGGYMVGFSMLWFLLHYYLRGHESLQLAEAEPTDPAHK